MPRRLLLLVSLLLVTTGQLAASPLDDFNALLDEHWEWQLAASPMLASRLGDDRYADRWTDLSLAAIDQRNTQRREFLRRLYAIGRADLPEAAQINYELFRRSMQDAIDLHQYRGHLIPFSHRGGIQNLESNADNLAFANREDYEQWLARLRGVATLIDQTIDLAERGRREGLIAPAITMQRVSAQIAAQQVDDPRQSPFFRVFESLPASIAAADARQLQDTAADIIDTDILPAYAKLARYFDSTYLPACRDSVGLAALPGGSEWYELLTRQFTTTAMTPDEVHRLGLEEVRRIRDEMQGIIDELEFDGDFNAFLEFLRTDPQFYYSDPNDLLVAYRETSKRIDPELVRLFGKLPRMPYGVRPIPDSIAPDTTTAYYTRPAGDGSRAGTFWVNLYKPEVRPKYEIEVLTVHEAMPGHHLQIALQQELGEMPAFRRYSGFTAFIEGWGLYSEALGYELGLYTDPYSRFGQLTYEMWRAVRLVVDTGLHYKGWTRAQAIDFFKDNAAKSELDIINEIDRYIGNPGQALAYKIGQLRMLALRRDASNTLGEDFDIRAFHDELLGGGALPLDMLQQRMDNWLRNVSR